MFNPASACKCKLEFSLVVNYNVALFTMQTSCPPVSGDFGNPSGRLFWEPIKISDIKWNFEKILVGPDGKPVMRWHPSVEVPVVRADIRRYLLDLYTKDIFN